MFYYSFSCACSYVISVVCHWDIVFIVIGEHSHHLKPMNEFMCTSGTQVLNRITNFTELEQSEHASLISTICKSWEFNWVWSNRYLIEKCVADYIQADESALLTGAITAYNWRIKSINHQALRFTKAQLTTSQNHVQHKLVLHNISLRSRVYCLLHWHHCRWLQTPNKTNQHLQNDN